MSYIKTSEKKIKITSVVKKIKTNLITLVLHSQDVLEKTTCSKFFRSKCFAEGIWQIVLNNTHS